MYKQSFSCKIYCTKVKQTAKKLHRSPDVTDKARSRSLLQTTPTPSPFDTRVDFQNLQVIFTHEGHWVKVKVTGAKKHVCVHCYGYKFRLP